MNAPPGHRMLCPACEGSGGIVKARATLMDRGPRIATRYAGEPCRPCEGTGWIPPKHEGPGETESGQ